MQLRAAAITRGRRVRRARAPGGARRANRGPARPLPARRPTSGAKSGNQLSGRIEIGVGGCEFGWEPAAGKIMAANAIRGRNLLIAPDLGRGLSRLSALGPAVATARRVGGSADRRVGGSADRRIDASAHRQPAHRRACKVSVLIIGWRRLTGEQMAGVLSPANKWPCKSGPSVARRRPPNPRGARQISAPLS